MGLLVDRFRDVPVADRNAALCSRMVGLNLARVHVAPSRIRNAGRGLFASRAIASGELVTLYPCDALLQWPNEQALALAQREAESVQAVRDDLDGLRRRMEEQSAIIATSDRARAALVEVLEEQAASHAAAIPKHAAELGAGKQKTTAEIIVHCDAVLATRRMLRPVVGDVLVRLSSHSAGMGLKECEAFDPLSEHGAAVWRYCIRMNATSAVLANPNLVEDAAYLGHLVNDGVICEGPGTAAVRYAITSAGLANVRTVASSLSDCHIALVSLRSIEQGGEILMSYGSEAHTVYPHSPLRMCTLPTDVCTVPQVWRCVLALATGGAAKAPFVPRRQHLLWRGSRRQDCWAGRVHRSQWESLCGPLSQWRVPWPRHVLPGGRTGRGEPLLRRTGGGSGCRMERRSSEGVAPRRSKRKGRRDEACGHFSGRCRFDCEGT